MRMISTPKKACIEWSPCIRNTVFKPGAKRGAQSGSVFDYRWYASYRDLQAFLFRLHYSGFFLWRIVSWSRRITSNWPRSPCSMRLCLRLRRLPLALAALPLPAIPWRSRWGWGKREKKTKKNMMWWMLYGRSVLWRWCYDSRRLNLIPYGKLLRSTGCQWVYQWDCWMMRCISRILQSIFIQSFMMRPRF